MPEGLDGVSLVPVFRDPAAELPARDLFWSRREGNLRYMGEVSWALRRGDWKLVKNSPYGPWELFNLAEDPAETTDLAKKNPKDFNELATAMRAHIQRCGRVPWQ